MRRQASRQKLVHASAPIGGLNTVASGVDMPATDSVLSYNLIGAEYGLRSRLGWREWVTGLGGQVRSLLPFTGSTKDGSANRLFATTETGIWDVSSSTAAPTQVLAFGTQGPDAGWGNSTVMVTAAGHFLCYWDEENGYHVYSENGGTWTAGGLSGNPVTGVDPSNLVFGMPWKNRLWMVERDTARAWYLGLGAVTGAATSFNFGQRFKAGGDLRCLASWTHGAESIDDELVAVSGGGDVVIYKGTDPSSASTFGLSGVWYVGAVPAGRRLTTDNGGDLLLMTSTGIQALSRLTVTSGSAAPTLYETGKIVNLWNQLQATTANQRGWAMRIHPQDACLMVLVPVASGLPTEQLVMSLSTKGWHRYRNLPMGVCAEPWGGALYFGTEDGRVCVNDGYVDGVLLSDPNSYSPIEWSLISSFTNLGDPRQKMVREIVTHILSQGGSVTHRAEARFNWDLTEVGAVTAPAASGSSSWDVGLWDSATWGGAYQPQRTVFGAYGMGSQVAVAIRGAASSRMTLTGYDVAIETGGLL